MTTGYFRELNKGKGKRKKKVKISKLVKIKPPDWCSNAPVNTEEKNYGH